jgi:hypothetical protein
MKIRDLFKVQGFWRISYQSKRVWSRFSLPSSFCWQAWTRLQNFCCSSTRTSLIRTNTQWKCWC